MKRILLSALFLCIAYFAFAQERRVNLMFKVGQIELSPEQKKELSDLSKKVKLSDAVTIFPLTYDSIFDRLTYATIADKQAAEIVKYAETLGFSLKGTVVNFPSSYKGRSVSVHLRWNGPLKIAHFPEKPSQFFNIDPNRDTVLKGLEGTEIYLKAGCLQTKNPVTVELKEFYSSADYIKSDLPTISNGKMLQSGGVIYLNAKETEQGKQVNIDPQSSIGVDFTMDKNDPAMQIFVKDPNSPNEMNWVLPAQLKPKESWQMTETTYDARGRVISSNTYKSREEWEKHLKDEEAIKLKKINELAVKTGQPKSDVILQVNNFGFINCDKFSNETMIPLEVSVDNQYSAKFYLVFKDIKSVMHGYPTEAGTDVSFGSVPKNRKATLVAIAFVDKQAYYYSQDITIGTTAVNKIVLQPVEESFMNQQISMIK